MKEIEEAMRLDAGAVEGGSRILFSYFIGQLDNTRCKPHLETIRRNERQRFEARQERNLTLDTVTYLPHVLRQNPRGVRGRLRGRCRPRARLAGPQDVAHYCERPLYIVLAQYRWFHEPTQGKLQALVGAMPDDIRRVIVKVSREAVARRIGKIADAEINRRG